MNIQSAVKLIKLNNLSDSLVIIGIEGYGGSGKTTIAKSLSEQLGNAYVVPLDDFIIKAKLTESSWDKGAFDRERLEQQVLVPATSGKNITYQKLIWESNTMSEPFNIPKVDYLIIEGISSYHPNIAKYYDYKIWVDTPIEIAKERGHARDGSNENAQYWGLWSKNDLKYQSRHHPEVIADIIIENA